MASDGEGGSANAKRKLKPAPTREQILDGSVGRLAASRGKGKEAGVVYISRLPPHLKPPKLRQMLERYGKLNRVYLAAADSARGGASSSSSGKSYTEGWVEFVEKRMAKRVARMLNGQQMGGLKKRSKYYSDLWTMKYIPGFKWEHLTEDLAYRRRVRDQRLASEVSAARKERDAYLDRVDQARLVEEIEARKRREGTREGLASIGARREAASRSFPQERAGADPVVDRGAPRVSKGLLRLIGGAGNPAKKRKTKRAHTA